MTNLQVAKSRLLVFLPLHLTSSKAATSTALSWSTAEVMTNDPRTRGTIHRMTSLSLSLTLKRLSRGTRSSVPHYEGISVFLRPWLWLRPYNDATKLFFCCSGICLSTSESVLVPRRSRNLPSYVAWWLTGTTDSYTTPGIVEISVHLLGCVSKFQAVRNKTAELRLACA